MKTVKQKQNITTSNNVSEESIRYSSLIENEELNNVTYIQVDMTQPTDLDTKHIQEYNNIVDNLDKEFRFTDDKQLFYDSVFYAVMSMNDITFSDVIDSIKSTIYHSNLFSTARAALNYPANTLLHFKKFLEKLKDENSTLPMSVYLELGNRELLLNNLSRLVGKQLDISDLVDTENIDSPGHILYKISIDKLDKIISSLTNTDADLEDIQNNKYKYLDEFLQSVFILDRRPYKDSELYEVFPELNSVIEKHMKRFILLSIFPFIYSTYNNIKKYMSMYRDIVKQGRRELVKT